MNNRRGLIPGDWDPSVCNGEDFFRSNVYCFRRLASDLLVQSKGIVLMFDLEHLGLKQARHFTPSIAMALAHILQVIISIPICINANYMFILMNIEIIFCISIGLVSFDISCHSHCERALDHQDDFSNHLAFSIFVYKEFGNKNIIFFCTCVAN